MVFSVFSESRLSPGSRRRRVGTAVRHGARGHHEDALPAAALVAAAQQDAGHHQLLLLDGQSLVPRGSRRTRVISSRLLYSSCVQELSSPPHTHYCSVSTWRGVHARSVRRVCYARDGDVVWSCSHDSSVAVRCRHVPGKLDDYVFKVQRVSGEDTTCHPASISTSNIRRRRNGILFCLILKQ